PSFAHHLRRPPFFCFFFSLPLPPPISTLFPYTTLFRSATRTCSRAVTLAIPHCQESQCDVDPIPAYSPQASRASNSPSTTRNRPDRKSTRLNSSHVSISYAVFCLKKKKNTTKTAQACTR